MNIESLAPSKRAELLEDIRLELIKHKHSQSTLINVMEAMESMTDAELITASREFWAAK